VLDLGVDFIVGKHTIYHKRMVHTIPDYFCAPPQHPSAVPHTDNALPALPQTRDEADQLPAPILQPAKPVGRQSRNTGEPLTCIPPPLHPPGQPTLGKMGVQRDKDGLDEGDNERKDISDMTDLNVAPIVPSHPLGPPVISGVDADSKKHDLELVEGALPHPKRHVVRHASRTTPLLSYIGERDHAPGRPFLGSVDVRRVKHVSEMLNFEEETYSILGDDAHLFPEASGPLEVKDILSAVQIDGPPLLQSAVRALVTEYRDIFSNDVGKSPAMVEPMKLQVDRSKWADSKNRTPPRPQSRLAEEEIRRQVNDLLARGVIKFSYSTEYSQVLMVKKKPLDPSLRFCLDFRILNDATECVDT
jgi:hypothetical protein